MELFAVVLFLLYASQIALTVTVDVYQGEPSVVLSCQYNKVLEEIVTVKWSGLGLNPNIVHQQREGDDLRGQNELFKGRTSMRPDALNSGDFSLTLSEPQVSDSGIYICSLKHETEEILLSDVQLNVKASRESFTIKVEVQEGAESVVLPCQFNQVLEEVVTVKWTRRDLNPSIVHQRREGDDLQLQNQLFNGRTSMRSDALDAGDFSLTLKDFQPSDIGNYICSMIDEHEEKTLSEVDLQLKASQDSLTKKVEVQWAQSVVLPCQYDQPLEEMVTVKWSRLDLNLSTVHQRREGDDLESQNQLFKERTSMRADALDSGDFSLTLKNPQLSDSGNYICSIIDDEDKELILSEVQLHVTEIPTWHIVLLVLLGLLVFAVSGGLLYHYRQKLGSAWAKILLGVLVVLVVLSVSVGLLFHFQHKFKSEIPAWAILVVFLLFFFTVDVGFLPHFRQKYNSETSTRSKSFLVLWALLLLVCPTVLVSLFFYFRHFITEIPFLWTGIWAVCLLFFQSGWSLFHVQKYLMSGGSLWMTIFQTLLPLFLSLVLTFLSLPELPTWGRIFLILSVLLFLTIEVGLLIRFRQHFISNRPRRPETVQSEETIALR